MPRIVSAPTPIGPPETPPPAQEKQGTLSIEGEGQRKVIDRTKTDKAETPESPKEQERAAMDTVAREAIEEGSRALEAQNPENAGKVLPQPGTVQVFQSTQRTQPPIRETPESRQPTLSTEEVVKNSEMLFTAINDLCLKIGSEPEDKATVQTLSENVQSLTEVLSRENISKMDPKQRALLVKIAISVGMALKSIEKVQPQMKNPLLEKGALLLTSITQEDISTMSSELRGNLIGIAGSACVALNSIEIGELDLEQRFHLLEMVETVRAFELEMDKTVEKRILSEIEVPLLTSITQENISKMEPEQKFNLLEIAISVGTTLNAIETEKTGKKILLEMAVPLLKSITQENISTMEPKQRTHLLEMVKMVQKAEKKILAEVGIPFLASITQENISTMNPEQRAFLLEMTRLVCTGLNTIEKGEPEKIILSKLEVPFLASITQENISTMDLEQRAFMLEMAGNVRNIDLISPALTRNVLSKIEVPLLTSITRENILTMAPKQRSDLLGIARSVLKALNLLGMENSKEVSSWIKNLLVTISEESRAQEKSREEAKSNVAEGLLDRLGELSPKDLQGLSKDKNFEKAFPESKIPIIVKKLSERLQELQLEELKILGPVRELDNQIASKKASIINSSKRISDMGELMSEKQSKEEEDIIKNSPTEIEALETEKASILPEATAKATAIANRITGCINKMTTEGKKAVLDSVQKEFNTKLEKAGSMEDATSIKVLSNLLKNLNSSIMQSRENPLPTTPPTPSPPSTRKGKAKTQRRSLEGIQQLFTKTSPQVVQYDLQVVDGLKKAEASL